MYTATKDEERTSDVKLAANKVKSDIRNGAHNVREDIEDAAHRAGRSVREFMSTANEELHHATDAVASQIRNKPVQSSLIALAAGFVIGALVRR